MAYAYLTLKLVSIALLLCLLMCVAGRMLEEEEGTSCWESMFHLQSCTTEVVMFFLNGETYLGLGCCKAIRIIQHDCWPEMMSSLGYSTQQGDILRGYCDALT